MADVKRIFPGLEGWNKSNCRVRTEQSNCIHASLTSDIMGCRYPEILQMTDNVLILSAIESLIHQTFIECWMADTNHTSSQNPMMVLCGRAFSAEAVSIIEFTGRLVRYSANLASRLKICLSDYKTTASQRKGWKENHSSHSSYCALSLFLPNDWRLQKE